MTLAFGPLERDYSEGLYRHPREEEGLVSGSWLRRGNSGLGSDVRGREPCLELRKVRGGQRAGQYGSEGSSRGRLEPEAELGKAVCSTVRGLVGCT